MKTKEKISAENKLHWRRITWLREELQRVTAERDALQQMLIDQLALKAKDND